MKPVISAHQLTHEVTSGGQPLRILNQLDLAVADGERVAIIGRSGSGKTTLLSLLAGLDTPTAGEVWLSGQRIDTLNEDGRAAARAGKVGFVFQSFQLLGGFTALENVMLPLELKAVSAPADVAADMLERVGLAARARHYPRQLSGGEQQRVALARAFCTSPDVLFADEPTGNLDQSTAARVMDLLFEMNAEFGTALVVVTHDDRLAARCERRLALSGGRVLV